MHSYTKKKRLYFDEVIRLHYKLGHSANSISRILPVNHVTVSRWIRIFEAENGKAPVQMSRSKSKSTLQEPSAAGDTQVNIPPADDIEALRSEVARLQKQLDYERMRADAYDEMINVAEAKFKIPVRKKAGAKR
jgi:hypothetical protein